MPNPPKPFDGDRDWVDVRSSIAKQIRRKYRPLNIEDVLEDVLSDVLCDLLGYWSSLSSSQKGEQLSFAFAVNRGVWMGTKKVANVFKHNAQEELFDPTQPQFLTSEGRIIQDEFGTYGIGAHGEASEGWEGYTTHIPGSYMHITDPDPLPDEQVIEMDEEERARAVLESLSSEELHDYFDNLLSGETERETAKRLDVSPATVHRRRAAQRTNLQEHARRYGLG